MWETCRNWFITVYYYGNYGACRPVSCPVHTQPFEADRGSPVKEKKFFFSLYCHSVLANREAEMNSFSSV